MAAMTTALTEFSDTGNSRTYTSTGHVVSKPKLVLQKRRVPSGDGTVAEDTITVLHGCEDSAGDILSSKVGFSVTIRRPIDSISADVSAALAVFRDIVAGDEFANTVDTQEYLT